MQAERQTICRPNRDPDLPEEPGYRDRDVGEDAVAIGAALFGVFVVLLVALGSAVEAGLILGTVPIAFVGGILLPAGTRLVGAASPARRGLRAGS